MSEPGRDRIRELLDAVLAEESTGDRLADMAAAAHVSPYHFARQVALAAGEPPVAIRRRVLLERAAWRLQHGAGVSEVAFEAGYDSADGFARAFSRAYGCPPSAMPPPRERGHWLPAPNGLHFHSPTVLYVDAGAGRADRAGGADGVSSGEVTAMLVRHDLEDTDALLAAALDLEETAYRLVRMPDHQILRWDTPDSSLAEVLTHLALDKEPWIATIEGADAPVPDPRDDVAHLRARHADLAGRWLALTRDVERRGAWHDRVVDALCEPPETFLLSQVLAHVLTFSAHRRQLARWMLAQAGVDTTAPALDPDPIMWHRRTTGGST